MKITSEKLTQTNVSEAWHVLRQLRNDLQEDQFSHFIDHASYKFLVFRHNQKIVAVCGYRMLETITRGWHCHVHDLAVDQTYRGHGIGSEVIRYLQSVVQKQSGRWIFLDGIDSALGFYEKIGFRRHAATLLKLKITA